MWRMSKTIIRIGKFWIYNSFNMQPTRLNPCWNPVNVGAINSVHKTGNNFGWNINIVTRHCRHRRHHRLHIVLIKSFSLHLFQSFFRYNQFTSNQLVAVLFLNNRCKFILWFGHCMLLVWFDCDQAKSACSLVGRLDMTVMDAWSNQL